MRLAGIGLSEHCAAVPRGTEATLRLSAEWRNSMDALYS